jgi:DNA repair exonuclease SbcCD ATPase subunit
LNYDLFLLDDGKECDIMNSYGGGVVSIISILLRIVTIVTLNLRRILILDESLAQLSSNYTANAAQFFKELGATLNFTIIMVTHDHSYVEYADKVYEVHNNGSYSILKEVSNVKNR